MFILWPHSRDTCSRKTATAATLRHVSPARVKFSDRAREEARGRRSETRPALPGLASPRIVRSSYQCPGISRSCAKKASESTIRSKLICPSQTARARARIVSRALLGQADDLSVVASARISGVGNRCVSVVCTGERLAERLCDSARERGCAFHGDLLAENRSHREFESIPATGDAQPRFCAAIRALNSGSVPRPCAMAAQSAFRSNMLRIRSMIR